MEALLGRTDDMGALVRAIRTSSGLTQEQLAQRLKVSFSTVNGWENGRHRPQRFLEAELERLAAEYGIQIKVRPMKPRRDK